MSSPELNILVEVDPEFADNVDVSLVQAAVEHAFTVAHSDRSAPRVSTIARTAEVSIRVTNDAEMHRLNRDYRNVDGPTDVLSFSFVAEQTGPPATAPPDWPTNLGEIIVAYPYAARQAEELGNSVREEIAWLVIHGTLQVMGYEHDTDERAVHMELLEQSALRRLGFSEG